MFESVLVLLKSTVNITKRINKLCAQHTNNSEHKNYFK